MANSVKVWTAAEDERMHNLYAEGMAWDKIGEAFGVSRGSAIAHGHRIGCKTRVRQSPVPRVTKIVPPPPPSPPETMRLGASSYHALPPGHQRSWQPLVEGTLLEGLPYPEQRRHF